MSEFDIIVSPPIIANITSQSEAQGVQAEAAAPVAINAPGTPPVGLPRGGTTGQIAAKASNNDWDIVWIDNTGGGGGGGISDAPNDANYYLRHGLAWSIAAVVAQTGAYADLTGKPTLGTAAAHADTDFAAAAHNQAASTITSGTFADARIAQSNVTQHQAALAIAASQVTSGTFADARIAVGNVTQHQASLSIDWSQMTGTPPPLLVTKVYTVSSQVAQLALTAEEGDLAIRTDQNKTYARNSGTAGTMADWSELLTPTDTVTSVFGRSGAVTAQSGDYTFAQIGSTPTTLAGYGITDAVPSSRQIITTAPLTGGGDLSANRTIAMPAATAASDGYATAAQITKLNGIQTGATANDTDANLKARVNHTGTQTASTISDFNTAADARVVLKKECIIIAASDETTNLTTGTGKVTFRMPYAFTLIEIRASLTTAQASGSDLIVDVNENGTTLMSASKLRFDNTEKTTVTSANQPVLTDTALANDSEITVDIDQVGTAGAKGLKIYLIGHQ
jgi:hypothetical protein